VSSALIDTSGWIALADPKAKVHKPVSKWFADWNGQLVTSTDILDETVAFANKRWTHRVALGLGEKLQDEAEVRLVEIDATIRQEAWQLFKSRPDKGYSLTDCTSFIVMRKFGIALAVTLDEHFQQEGFEVVPAPE